LLLPQALAQTRNPDREAYFGETHVPISWSLDARLFGNRITDPGDAYKYLKSEPIRSVCGGARTGTSIGCPLGNEKPADEQPKSATSTASAMLSWASETGSSPALGQTRRPSLWAPEWSSGRLRPSGTSACENKMPAA
jgi:Protein of unknown function (DUF3604)